MKELSLFSGAGGGLLATQLLGWRCIGYVEMAEYPCRVLEQRINDGLLSRAPIFNMHTRDFIESGIAEIYRGLVDVITAGFPCQPFAAGGKRQGGNDERNGWPELLRIIEIVRPQWCFLENSPKLLSPFRKAKLPAYFNTIQRDLARIGYDVRWGCLSSSTLGADHKRRRLWIVAYPHGQRRPQLLRMHQAFNTRPNFSQKTGRVGDANSLDAIFGVISQLEDRLGEPSVCGVNDGLARRVDRLTAIGNGQDPIVAKTAWQLLSGESD